MCWHTSHKTNCGNNTKRKKNIQITNNKTKHTEDKKYDSTSKNGSNNKC